MTAVWRDLRLNCARNQIAQRTPGIAAQPLRPRGVNLRPFGWRRRSVFDDIEAGGPVTRDQSCFQEFEREWSESESFDLRAVAFRVESDDNLQPGFGSADAPQVLQHRSIAGRHCAQQTAPRKMDVDFVGYAVKFRGQRFDRSLDEEHVRQSALRRFAMNLLGDFLQRARLRIYPDEEPVGMSPGRLVDKAPVARPDIHDHAAAGMER